MRRRLGLPAPERELLRASHVDHVFGAGRVEARRRCARSAGPREDERDGYAAHQKTGPAKAVTPHAGAHSYCVEPSDRTTPSAPKRDRRPSSKCSPTRVPTSTTPKIPGATGEKPPRSSGPMRTKK